MSLLEKKTKSLLERAKKVTPYGVNSNFRYYGEDTFVIKRGLGAHIWDADDKKYIDYRLGFGPIILGHAHPAVIERVTAAIKEGTLFAWTNPWEISVAERIARMCKMDMVKLTNTGSEATMHALRTARAYTGRERFIKFEGNYHGMSDYFLYSTASSEMSAIGSRRSPVPAGVSSGIPKAINQYVTTLPFNDVERLEETIENRWQDLAAVFIEPLLGNMGGIMPKPDFLQKLRQLCTKYNILLVFDEVKTGFRIANGGAQEYFGVRADLATYAKALANGFPIAAIAGREDVMMSIEPGKVSNAGTYSGNVVGAAAADATLEILETEPVIADIFSSGKKLMDGIDEILTEADIPHHMAGLPSIFGFALGTNDESVDFRDHARWDFALYEEIGRELIRRGVMTTPDTREPWFLSRAHDDTIIGETLNVFNEAIRNVKKKI